MRSRERERKREEEEEGEVVVELEVACISKIEKEEGGNDITHRSNSGIGRWLRPRVVVVSFSRG